MDLWLPSPASKKAIEFPKRIARQDSPRSFVGTAEDVPKNSMLKSDVVRTSPGTKNADRSRQVAMNIDEMSFKELEFFRIESKLDMRWMHDHAKSRLSVSR